MLLAAAQAGIEVREATPNEVKSAVTGYGAADKEQVARMVAVRVRLPRAADAGRRRGRARDRRMHRPQPRVWSGGPPRRPGRRGLDRASLRPLARGESGYERAVRDALAREGHAARRATRRAS